MDILDFTSFSDSHRKKDCKFYHNSSLDGEAREYCGNYDNYIHCHFRKEGEEDLLILCDSDCDCDCDCDSDRDDGYHDFCYGS